MNVLEILKLLSGAVTSLLVIGGFLVGVFKPIRVWFYNRIKKVTNSDSTAKAISEISATVSELKAVFETQIQASEVRDAATASIIRNEITKIYYTYLEKKAMPAREKENMLRLYESYSNLGGNSYITAIVDEMMRWDTFNRSL